MPEKSADNTGTLLDSGFVDRRRTFRHEAFRADTKYLILLSPDTDSCQQIGQQSFDMVRLRLGRVVENLTL